jgi:hypothetical protein
MALLLDIKPILILIPNPNPNPNRGDRDVMDIRDGGEVLIHQPMTKVRERLLTLTLTLSLRSSKP